MQITLVIDTDDALSQQDRVVLLAIAGEIQIDAQTTEPSAAVQAVIEQVKETAAEPEETKPAPKKRTRRTKAQIEADKAAEEAAKAAPVEEPTVAAVHDAEPTPEPIKVEETPLPEEPTEDLRAKAIRIATELVAAGKAADVRKVLNEIGVRRVSEVPDEHLERFLSAVEAA